MSATETIKNYILSDCRMDSVGIAPASALAGEPEGHRPEDILPGAKSVIVFTRRIPDGVIQAAFRSREDGNADAHSIYAAYGSDLTPNMNVFFMQFNIAQFIEMTFGYTAMPVPSGPMQNVTPVNVPLPVFIGPKKNAYILHPERAAYAAGLGDLAWNNMLVTEKNGPRQVVGLVVTSMELDRDWPYGGPRLCDPETCGVCGRICPTHAIPPAGGVRGGQYGENGPHQFQRLRRRVPGLPGRIRGEGNTARLDLLRRSQRWGAGRGVCQKAHQPSFPGPLSQALLRQMYALLSAGRLERAVL